MHLALVTGGADGLGREFCRRLLQSKNYNVCFGDVNEEKGEETRSQLASEFGSEHVMFMAFDVCSEEMWYKTWSKAEDHFGMSIDLLVNNAGMGPVAGWRRNVDVMLVGHMMGGFIAMEKMGRSRGGQGGRIINVASVAGLTTGLGGIESVGYIVAKWGSVAFTYSFATSKPKVFEMEGIKAMAICPWFAHTNIVKGMETTIEKKTRMRLLKTEEVGQAFLDILQLDDNGHVYAVMPDAPLLDVPNANQAYLFLSFLLGRFLLKPIGMDVINSKHVIVSIIFCLFAILLLFYFGINLIF